MLSQILIACALCIALLSQQVSGTAENGLPLLSSVSPYPIPVLASLLYNSFEVRNMTANEQWCTFDEERKEWCGGNYTNPYLLCIVLDQPWPFDSQSDLEEYLNQTDVAPATSIWPGINAICICDLGPYPTNPRLHAYVIPEDPVPVPRFQPDCHAEAGLLFCFILEAVLYFLLGYWALLEVVMWILMFVVKEKPFNILGGFLPKIFILLTCLLMVINIGMINGSASSTPQWQFAIFWTWVWIAMFLVSAYLWWLVVFADVVTKTKNMSRETTGFITITKWLIVFFVCGLLIGFCIAMGLSYQYALEITTEPNFRVRAQIAPSYYAARKTNITLGCIMIFIITIWGLGLTLYSAYLIVGNKNEGIKKTMREKTFWNTIACIFWWPVLFTLVVYAYYVSWHVIDISQYQTQIAFMWIYMIEAAAAFFVLLSITIALRTNFASGSGYCASICGNIKTIEETRTSSKGSSSRGTSKSKGAMTAGSTIA